MIERYTLPEMGAIWTDRAKYQSWLDVEVAACEANCSLGRVPEPAMEEIRAEDSPRPPEDEVLDSTLDDKVNKGIFAKTNKSDFEKLQARVDQMEPLVAEVRWVDSRLKHPTES